MSGFAWVTLATNDSYSLGALVLAQSLKESASKHATVVLVTAGVSASMRTKLAAAFNNVEEVNILDSKDEKHLQLLKRPELGITFTKLHCWRLTQFQKCVFLDADTLVLKNVDDLFDREEFSAAPDVGWPDCFNSGVFVYRPSIQTYDKLIQFALDNGSFDGGDQGLLNSYFSDWTHKDISKHLPFIYNMCSVACYSYLPAYKRFGSDAKIVHFIGSTKPWLQYFNSETQLVQPANHVQHLQPILQQWWDLFVKCVHANLTPDMGGLAGAFAQFSVGVARTQDQSQLEDTLRKQSWEVGSVDYLGRDSFDRIWSKISESVSTQPQAMEEVKPSCPEAKAVAGETAVDQTAAPATIDPPPTSEVKADQGSLQTVEKAVDVPIETKPQEMGATDVPVEPAPPQTSKPEEKTDVPVNIEVKSEAIKTDDIKLEEKAITAPPEEKVVDTSTATTETSPVVQAESTPKSDIQEKVQEKAAEQIPVECPAATETKPTETSATTAPEAVTTDTEVKPDVKPEVIANASQQESEQTVKVADEPKPVEGETKPASEAVPKECDLPQSETAPAPEVIAATPPVTSDVAASATPPIEVPSVIASESAAPVPDVELAKPITDVSSETPETGTSETKLADETLKTVESEKPATEIHSVEPVAVAKPEEPSKAETDVKSEEPIALTTDVKPEEAHKTADEVKPEEPVKSEESVKLTEPKVVSDVKPEEPVKSEVTEVKAEVTSPTDVKSEEPVKQVTADVKLEELPKVLTDVKPEEAVKSEVTEVKAEVTSTTDVKAEEPVKQAADVKLEELPKVPTDVKPEEAVMPVTESKSEGPKEPAKLEGASKEATSVKTEEAPKPADSPPTADTAPVTVPVEPVVDTTKVASQIPETPLAAAPAVVAPAAAPTGHKTKDAGSQPVAPPRKGSGGKKSKK